MAREQPIVARDFLGLGKMGDSTEMDDLEGKHHAFHDVDPSTFLGLKQSGMLSKLHETNVGEMVGPAAGSMNCSNLLHRMSFPGMMHPIWNKAATMQGLLPLRSLHEERFVEQSAENLPERSVPHLVHPLQMQDLVNNNQRNALCTQAWWQGDFLMNISAQARDECDPSAHFSGGFGGPVPKTMLSLSMSDVNVLGGDPAATETRMPSSSLTERQGSGPLTIFYAGNVKVFNGVSAEKAQAIMFLASGGNAQHIPVELLTAAVVSESMPGTFTPNPHDKSHINLQIHQTVASHQVTANQVSHSTQLNFAYPNTPAPSSPLTTGQPVVPRALPQARKASLARFLEKRRERVQSKSPYPLKQTESSLPEERFSSSNDPASYTPCGDCVDKKRVPISSWMERMSEYSTCDMVVKEEADITATWNFDSCCPKGGLTF